MMPISLPEDSMTEMKICSFTGHRKIEKEHEKLLPGLLKSALRYAYDEGCRYFISGGALGFDTEVAKELIAMRMMYTDIRIVLALPCKNQSDNWQDRDKSVYEYSLSVADEIVYTADEYTDGCMKKRNKYLAESCDMMISYVGRGGSGSSQTARIAESLGKPVYNLYPRLCTMARENQER